MRGFFNTGRFFNKGSDDPAEWTDVGLGLANFHITAREGSTETDKWTFSNPTGTSLRIKRDSSDVSDWDPGANPWSGTPADSDQRGPAIIYKVQMDPRPLVANALAGVTDNRWRHGECQLTVAMRLSEPSRPSGGYGHAIGCGVGFLFSKTDLGSGAALVTSDPTPPFLGTQASPDIGYATAFLVKSNDSTSVNWNREVKSRSGNNGVTDWYDTVTETGPFGAASHLDTAVIQLPHHPFITDNDKGLFRHWFEDSRVNRAAVNGYYPGGGGGSGSRTDSVVQIQGYQLDTEGTYVYIVIMPTITHSDSDAIDSEIDVLELKFNLSHIKVGA